MKDEMKRLMAKSIHGFRMPRYGELPDMGLYLEQTAKYVNHYLSPLGCLEITTSMVSNYVKKGVIPKPVKKQYFAEHIAYLFFVAMAKNLVAIEDIRLLIAMQNRTYTLPVAYDYLCEELENILPYIFGEKDVLETLGETDSDEKNLLRSMVFSVANVVHMNACFSLMRSGYSAYDPEEIAPIK